MYSRDLVEQLLPAVWDETYAYGMPKAATAPSEDMPKGSVNKSHGNTLFAHLADIKTGWEAPDLSIAERQAVLLHYGLDLIEAEVGAVLGKPRTTVQYNIFTGIGKIVSHLNGTTFSEIMEESVLV